MSPPTDGHVHDTDDPRSHSTAHLPHDHGTETPETTELP
jgi:hypothetical protein